MRLLLAGTAAILLKILLAASTAGTNDVRTWEHDLTSLRTDGFAELYRSGVQYRSPAGLLLPRQAFIHPPPVLHGLRWLGYLQDATGLPLRFWLRTACAFADAGTLLLLWRMFGNRVPVLLTLSPISILISGFHGNTDPIMMFFIAGAVFFAERGNPGRAGILFGLACGVKLIPMIFAPAILLCLTDVRSRLRWGATAAAVWIGLSMPYIAQEPVLILRSLLGYGSATGLWGLSLASALFGAGRIYNPVAKWIAILAASCVPFLMKRRLFEQCGLVALTFLFLSPGFGLQYLAWAVPWTALLDRRSMIAYHAAGSIFALTVYAAASQTTAGGLYADLLNSLHFPVMALMGVICWITIGVIVWRSMRGREKLWAAKSPARPARAAGRESIE